MLNSPIFHNSCLERYQRGATVLTVLAQCVYIAVTAACSRQNCRSPAAPRSSVETGHCRNLPARHLRLRLHRPVRPLPHHQGRLLLRQLGMVCTRLNTLHFTLLSRCVGAVLGVLLSSEVSGGHINPAVTVALATLGKFPWSKVIIVLHYFALLH